MKLINENILARCENQEEAVEVQVKAHFQGLDALVDRDFDTQDWIVTLAA